MPFKPPKIINMRIHTCIHIHINTYIPKQVFQAGFSIAGLGDINNDGYNDIAITSADAATNSKGSVHIILGKKWPVYDTVIEVPVHGDLEIDGTANGDSIHKSVAAAGDVNGDGVGGTFLSIYLCVCMYVSVRAYMCVCHTCTHTYA